MTEPIDILVAETRLSKLVARAEAGHETVIARAGKPVAKLVPLVTKQATRKLGELAGKLDVPADFDVPMTAKGSVTFEWR